MSFPSAFRSHVEQSQKSLENETTLIGHPYCRWKMDVALVGERVVPRQWEVGGGENEDECTASPIDMISHSLTGIASNRAMR